MSESTPFISVVIPVTVAEVDIDSLLEGYSRPLREAGLAFELIFVLDGLHGRIVEEFERVRKTHPVKIVRLQGDGLGESIALSAGAARARGGFIVNAPQYLQSEPEDILQVVQGLDTGADFVATWRHPRVDPWLNRVQSRLFNWVLRVLMGVRFHDLNSSLRGMRRQVIEEVNVYGEMYRFLPVLAQRQGFRVVEVKVRHREEKGAHGFYGIGVYLRRMLDILAITFLTRFTQKPLRFFGTLGIIAMLVGTALCIDPLIGKLGGDSIAERPIFVLGVIVGAFGVQLIGFGLVGEIIIFTQAGQMRDYKIEDFLEGGASAGDAGGVEVEVRAEVDGEAPVRVRELVPGEDARWDSYVREHPQGTFFHLTGWRRVVAETFGHEPHDFVAEQGRAWVGVLPLFWVKSPFVGRQLISVPYAVYGGVLSDSVGAQEGLLEAACQYGRRLGAGYLETRHLEERTGERPRIDLYITFRKELPEDAAEVMPAIPKKARAEVRRARDRFGMRFEQSDDIELFYNLFSQEKRRLGTPSLPLLWFKNLREEFGEQIVVHVVRSPEGEAVVAVMSFCFKDTVYAYYSGSGSNSRGKGVNDFAYCRLMEWAVENGYRQFDFGRSRRDTGAARFKHNMGFEETELHYEYSMLKDDATLPEFHPSNPRLQTPRRIWSKLPSFVTTRVGGRLSRYLP